MKTHLPIQLLITCLLGTLLHRCSAPTATLPASMETPPLIDCALPPPASPNIRPTCSADRAVKDSCAIMWVNAWNKTWKYKQGFGHTYADSSFILPDDSVRKLLDMCPSCETVRIYFGFEWTGEDSVLSVILVNADTLCNDVYLGNGPEHAKAILYKSALEGSSRFISLDMAKQHAINWASLFGSDMPDGFHGFQEINAYNYRRHAVAALVDRPDDFLAVNFSVHEVVQQDQWYLLSKTAYVHDLLLQAVTVEHTHLSNFMDFAMPCPRFCGDKSLVSDPE
jgi:hypothetical protein